MYALEESNIKKTLKINCEKVTVGLVAEVKVRRLNWHVHIERMESDPGS